MWEQSRSNCFFHNSHRQKVVNTLIWYKVLYFWAYWSGLGLTRCRTVQNEELIEDEKFVPPLDGEAAFAEIRGKAALKRGPDVWGDAAVDVYLDGKTIICSCRKQITP